MSCYHPLSSVYYLHTRHGLSLSCANMQLNTTSSKQLRDISDDASASITLSLIILDCYRPQAKVMFSEASVCSRGGSPFRGTETTLDRNLPGQKTPFTETPLDRDPPPVATAAVGTLSTGMHSRFYLKLYYNYVYKIRLL